MNPTVAMLSLLGVTGERAKMSDGATEMGRRLKAATDRPVARA